MTPVLLNQTETLAEAYRCYAHDLYRHCRFRRFTGEDAEEIVQETFLNVWEYLRSGREIENLRAFLYRVANNLIVDKVRKRKQGIEMSLDALQEQGFDPGEDKTDALQNHVEVRRLLHSLKEEVGEEEHNLLELRYMHELMPADIALRTGISSNAVSVRLHRALKKVSAFLKQR